MAQYLQRNPWIIPLLFAVLFAAVGRYAYTELRTALKAEIASELEVVRDTAEAALRTWAQNKRAQVQVQAADQRVVEYTRELLRAAQGAEDPAAALLASPYQGRLRERVSPAMEHYGFPGFASVSMSGLYLAAGRDEAVGTQSLGVSQLLPRIREGETLLTRPMGADMLGPVADEQALMLVATPLRNAEGDVIAGFGFSIIPGDEFARILAVARSGESGETYAFDREGRLVSASRFEDSLVGLGLLAAGQSSEMNVQIRDPGGDLTQGFEPKLPVEARPLTRAAADAIAGHTGVDVEGYPDYRGVPVVGAWTWIPQLEIGIATELDRKDAYAPLVTLRKTTAALMSMLALAALGMFLYSFLAVRLRRKMAEVRQLGRYRIESRVGRGGMGTVYLARHALLRRPTAVKVLNAERAGNEGVARFEREVQITSALRHPNTIEIYDYGYTQDGTFYYAMEYLEGVDVGDCVQETGAQPEARVLHVMRQACGSIAEAHATGLMHRDIKPSNIRLCERGGLFDFVKVLDFGLVREQQQSADAALTDQHSITGTPLFMPPEAVRSPDSLDCRGDVYQLGLVAYYLLTGRHVFTADNPMDVMLKHVSEPPEPPSKVLGHPVSPDLEQLILRCLAKDPAARPADAVELLEAFEACQVSGGWGPAEARAWWAQWKATAHARAEQPPSSTGSLPSGIDLAERSAHGTKPSEASQ